MGCLLIKKYLDGVSTDLQPTWYLVNMIDMMPWTQAEDTSKYKLYKNQF